MNGKEQDLYEAAVKKYLSAAKQRCYSPAMPGYYSSWVGRKYVYLANCNGLLCRYIIKTKKILFGDGEIA